MIDLKHILDTYPQFRCRPGWAIIHLEPKPDRAGSIVLCGRSRDLQVNESYQDVAWWGKVVAMAPRKDDGTRYRRPFEEGFSTGDRVWVMLTGEDLHSPGGYIITRNERVYAKDDGEG